MPVPGTYMTPGAGGMNGGQPPVQNGPLQGQIQGQQPGQGQQPQSPQYGQGMYGIGGGMYGVNPSAAIGQFNQGMAPDMWQANRNAMQAASASGLSGGPLQDVINQANTQFLTSMDPTIANMIMQAQTFNAGQANQGTLQNQMLQAQQNMAGAQNSSNAIQGLLGGLGMAFGF